MDGTILFKASIKLILLCITDSNIEMLLIVNVTLNANMSNIYFPLDYYPYILSYN